MPSNTAPLLVERHRRVAGFGIRGTGFALRAIVEIDAQHVRHAGRRIQRVARFQPQCVEETRRSRSCSRPCDLAARSGPWLLAATTNAELVGVVRCRRRRALEAVVLDGDAVGGPIGGAQARAAGVERPHRERVRGTRRPGRRSSHRVRRCPCCARKDEVLQQLRIGECARVRRCGSAAIVVPKRRRHRRA